MRASAPRLALCAAALLFLARAAVLLARDRFATGAAPDLALQRLAHALPVEAALAVVFAFGWTLVVLLAAQRGRLVALAGALVASGLLALYLIGALHAGPSRLIGLATERGRLATAVLAGASLGASALASFAAARGRLRPVRGGAAFAAGVLVLTPVGARAAWLRTSPEMVVSEVIAELALDDGSWVVVREHPKYPVRATLLNPSTDWRLEGGERPALEMVPPAEVRLNVPRGVGDCRLLLAGGIDEDVWNRLERVEPERTSVSLRFEVELDGRSVFDEVLTVDREAHGDGSSWVPVAEGGIAVRGGEELVLRTHVPEDRGEWLRPVVPLRAGFGGLVLERTRRRPRAEASAERPNIVFVVMDTLRADRTSTYGYGRPTTPRLDRLAERGMLFEVAQSAGSYTWPATGSLLTGLLPEQHGVVDSESCYLAHDLDTLAEALQTSGYTTAAFSGNPLIVPGKGFDQGFEFFDHAPVFRKSEQFVPDALEWIELFAEQRFFAYFQLVDPHDPLEPTAESLALLAPDVPPSHPRDALSQARREIFDGATDLDAVADEETRRRISDLYDAAVHEGDLWFGHIVDTLERCGVLDETVVVFTSDHGEELFDRGHAGHGQSLHQELIHVPMVLAGPGVPVGRRVAGPVSTRHLAPTLAALGGAHLGVEDGLPLTSLAGSGVGARTLFSTRSGWWNGMRRTPLHGVRDGDLVLHWAPEAGEAGTADADASGGAPGAHWRLFDLARDPSELEDLSRERAEEAEALRAWLGERLRELEVRRRSPGLGAETSTLELLRRIGYERD